MEHKISEAYKKIWKHLADKYDSEGASVEEMLEEKAGIPKNERL